MKTFQPSRSSIGEILVVKKYRLLKSVCRAARRNEKGCQEPGIESRLAILCSFNVKSHNSRLRKLNNIEKLFKNSMGQAADMH